jgi:O-antigen/teichoic acid export membrane protein
MLYLIRVRPTRPSQEMLASLWQYAQSSIPGGLVGTALNRMDVLLLGLLVSNSVAGEYEVAMRLATPGLLVAGVAAGGITGRVSHLHSRGEEFSAEVRKNLAYASLFAVPMVFGGIIMADAVVVTAYGQKFAGAIPYLVGLSIWILFKSQRIILASTISGMDKPELNL